MKADKIELENIKKQIKELEENYGIKNRFTNYLKNLDEEFESHTENRIRETPLLIALFRKFTQEIYQPSKIYKKSIKIKHLINDELDNNLNNEQKDLLEQWRYCEDRISEDITEQAFIYGYAIASQLRYEAIKQYPHSKNSKFKMKKFN